MHDAPNARVLAEWNAAFGRAIKRFEPQIRMLDEGRIVAIGDGIATISGLPSVTAEELVHIGDGTTGLVLGLEPDVIFAVVLDAADQAERGARVRRTRQRASIDVGPELLGRIVDPLGRPLDGRRLGAYGSPMPLERDAPGVHERAAVHQPLYTGILAIDAMLPIGRGQRELIAGDEGTGKTSIALDALARQASTDVIGVYVAIGRRRAETWRAAEELRKVGGRWIIVAAPEDTSPGLRYLAPYAGCAVAEYFMDRGDHTLVVYDDLTSHAVAWRELSLLMRRPPGREAFPGDVFYLHSRLLERATQLGPTRGGGSLTALPIARLESGRLSAYLPTNLISITDGQIVLSRSLYSAGELPAIDMGLSVSRVGGKAQPQAIRELAGKLRLDYAGFLELEVFSRIGARLEESVERRLAIGRRQRALLRQGRLSPRGVFGTVVQLAWATDPELLRLVPESAIADTSRRLEAEVSWLEPELARRVEEDPRLSSADDERLDGAIRSVIERLHPRSS